MQIRTYGNRHDGSKILNGTVTVQLDGDLEPDFAAAYQTTHAKVEVWLARANAPQLVHRTRRRSSAAASAPVPAKKTKVRWPCMDWSWQQNSAGGGSYIRDQGVVQCDTAGFE